MHETQAKETLKIVDGSTWPTTSGATFSRRGELIRAFLAITQDSLNILSTKTKWVVESGGIVERVGVEIHAR
jgi:hypothetical protein